MKKDRKQIFGKFKQFFTNIKQKKFNWKVVKCVDEKTECIRSVEDISKDVFSIVRGVIE